MGAWTRRGSFFLLMLFITGTQSQAQIWDTISPPKEGGFILSTTRKGNVHYALDGRDFDGQLGACIADLYVSTNDGESWQKRSLPEGVRAMIHRIALDSLGSMYYHTEWNVYRSTDEGVTWNMITYELDATRTFVELHIDAASRLFLLSGKLGLVMTTNHGNNWSNRTLPSPSDQPTLGRLACVGETLFFWWNQQTRGDTLFRSTDQGATWSSFLVGRSPLAVIDGGNGTILVSQRMIEGGIVPFRILSTRDDGQNWDTLYTARSVSGYSNYSIEKTVFRRSDQGGLAHVLLDTTRVLHVITSEDGGATWKLLSNGAFTGNSAIGFDARGQLFVYGGNFGFLRYPVLTGDPERAGFLPIALNRPPAILPDGSIYALSEMSEDARIFYWDSATRMWTAVEGPAVTGDVFTRPSTLLFTTPPDTLFAVTGTLARTVDMGRSWENILPATVISYGNTSMSRGRWFGVSWDSIYVSGNNGRDWEAMVRPDNPNLPFGMAAENDSSLFYLPGIYMTLWRKPVGSNTWTMHSLPWRTEAVTTGMDNTIFIRGFGGAQIARSSNHGASWETLPIQFGKAEEVLALARDTLIVLDTTRGLYISPDRGSTWTLLPLPEFQPRSMATRDGTLYIGTERLGMLRTALRNVFTPIVLSQPDNLATCLPRSVTLAWSTVSSRGPFRVRCGTDSTFAESTIVCDSLVHSDTLTLVNLTPGSRYFWDVEDANGQMGTLRSMPGSFRIASVPATEITMPAAAATCVDPNVQIAWARSECVDSSEVEISIDPNFQSVVSDITTSGSVNSAGFTLDYATNYHARVRSTSAAGAGPWSPAITFRTIDDTVAAPLQSEPADGSMFTTVPPSFIKWEAVNCVNRSEIVTSRTQDFSADTVSHAFRQNPYNSVTISGAQRLNGTYYWKVRAWRDSVPGHWSPVWSFTLDIPVNVEATSAAEDMRILRIYPQPAEAQSGLVTVECAVPASTSTTLIVCDMLGRERMRLPIARTAQGSQSMPIDVSALPSGQYLIVLQGGSQRDSAPLLIAR